MSDLLLEPAYGKKLKCLAGDCPENCCMEWIIDIDNETAAYYRTVQGEFGDELRKWMRVDGRKLGDTSTIAEQEAGAEPCGEAPQAAQAASAPDGRDVLDDSGLFTGTSCTTFALNGTNCPFLQEDGLCRLRLTLGYEHTSETCREHPYNTEEYEGFAERSPSVSCPEVVRLVFETPVNGSGTTAAEDTKNYAGTAQSAITAVTSFTDAQLNPALTSSNAVKPSVQTYPDAPTNADDAVLNILARTRNSLLSAEAFDESLPLDAHIIDLIRRVSLLQPIINDEAREYAFEFSDDIADQLISGFEEYRTADETPLLITLQDFCLFLRENLSILTDRWKHELEEVQTCAFDMEGVSGGAGMPGMAGFPAGKMLAGTGKESEVSSYRWDAEPEKKYPSFGAYLDAHRTVLSRLYAYYVYRYFLKAVNDCETPVWAGFIACGAFVPAFLSYANGTPLMKTAAWYSREIEHDSDNAEKILAYFRANLSTDWEDFT